MRERVRELGRGQDPDRVVYLRSARWIGVRVAVVSVALVLSIAVAVIAYVLWQLTPGQLGEQHGPEDVRIYLDTIDVAIAFVGVGGFAVLAAGVATWLIARRAVRPLGEALRMQRTFVADAGHELRTPLTVLSARVQQLRALPSLDLRARELLEELSADTKTLSDIVTDLLQTAAGETDPNARTDVGEVLEAVSRDMSVLARERGVGVEIRADDALLAVPTMQVRRCLVALVDNAIAHSPRGGTVAISALARERSVLIRVADHGSGIAGVSRDRVFERFAHGSAEPLEPGTTRAGYGIGLALVRDVAVRHGGSVRVQSTGAGGTTFALELPRATDAR